ncbi:MAG: molybdenum cofactor guanylyltransferase [Rickettsiaceae bacterium]|nr:molybdenum cofactor guanylyltransferase [Rickettsiaceae bacterium]
MSYVHTFKNTTGVILAGGKSSRMGENKALLQINKLTLLEHAIIILESLKLNNIYISGNICPDIIPNNKYPIIDDNNEFAEHNNKSNGPIVGIYSSINYIIKNNRNSLIDNILFIPVDMPLLNNEILSNLILSLNNKLDAAYYFSGPLPLIINLTDNMVRWCLQNIENINGSLKNFLTSHETKVLSVPHNIVSNLVNLNTPTDYNNLQKV